MAKIDAKFDEFRHEQSTLGPVSAMLSTLGPATITQSTHGPAIIAQSIHGPVASTSAEPARRRHGKRVRSPSPDLAVNSSDSDELTDNNPLLRKLKERSTTKRSASGLQNQVLPLLTWAGLN